MPKNSKLLSALLLAGLLAAGMFVAVIGWPSACNAVEALQPYWLLKRYVSPAEDYLEDQDREALLKEFIIAQESGYGGRVITELEEAARGVGEVPPLRLFKASLRGSKIGGRAGDWRPQSSHLTAALASGDRDAISLEAELHLAQVFSAASPIVYDSPLSWSTDLDGDLLDLDDGRLRRLVRWFDPRRKARNALAEAADEGATLASAFEKALAVGMVEVAAGVEEPTPGSVQLKSRLLAPQSDSIFQISRSVDNWEVAEAILSEDAKATLDSLRRIPALTVERLREILRPMVVYRLAANDMEAHNSAAERLLVANSDDDELKADFRLSPKPMGATQRFLSRIHPNLGL